MSKLNNEFKIANLIAYKLNEVIVCVIMINIYSISHSL